ncbi:molybdenum cofactor biosynthesis protein MoaE [Planctomycetaceae bacterium SH139]
MPSTNCQTSIELTDDPLDAAAILALVADDDCGAQMIFLGCTRRTTGERITQRLTYEAYRSMAISELRGLAEQAANRWKLRHLAIYHRLGEVAVGQASVAIAASSPHRPDVMAAIPWLMDRLKEAVPIWKQETFADGSSAWIHP